MDKVIVTRESKGGGGPQAPKMCVPTSKTNDDLRALSNILKSYSDVLDGLLSPDCGSVVRRSLHKNLFMNTKCFCNVRHPNTAISLPPYHVLHCFLYHSDSKSSN